MLVPGTNKYDRKYCGRWKNGKKHVSQCAVGGSHDRGRVMTTVTWRPSLPVPRVMGRFSTGTQRSTKETGVRTRGAAGAECTRKRGTFMRESG